MTTTVEGDFYEDDEPIEKILAIWENSPKTLTGHGSRIGGISGG